MESELNPTLSGAQRGLLLRPIFGQILTLFLKQHDGKTFEALNSIIQSLDDDLVNNHDDDCGFAVAFAPSLWGQWADQSFDISTKVLDRGINLNNTGGDVLFYLKAPDKETAARLASSILPSLEPLAADIEVIEAGKRSDGRVIGGRYVDHITNPNDPISLVEEILIPGPEPYRGATFGMTQKFILDWPDISSQSGDALDAVIGRKPNGEVISQNAERAHIHRAHVLDEKTLDQRKLLRQALPFGESDGQASREEGIMFVAFCNDQQLFETILQSMIGDRTERPADSLMDFVQGVGGSYWYVPSATELSISGVRDATAVYEDTHWSVRSPNGYLFYNSRDYMHQMANGEYIGGDPPSVRILSLMSRTFSHWSDGWTKQQTFPRLPHLQQLLPAVRPVPKSILERKGLANLITLSDLVSSPDSEIARKAGLTRIVGKELIVGAIPDFSIGRGKEVVPYLDDDETMAAWLKAGINEWSAMGHIVPNFQTLVDKGLAGLLAELQQRREEARDSGDDSKASFFTSAIDSLRGIQNYLRNWAEIARQAQTRATEPEDKANLQDIIARLERLVASPPAGFHDAVQLIFSVHCCLHLVGELTAFGRLDQILWPFLDGDLQRNAISIEQAQEIVDNLWIKIGENAFINRAFIHDSQTYGTGSVDGRGGNPPRGGSINQWVQQITLGGYKATDDATPEGGANPVTLLFLRASRRIPVNAPSLSMRVYKDMPEEFLHEAAKALLAGGAHPAIYNDDLLCEGLFQSGETVTRAWSRDYAADGCFEPMLTGASEFAFGNIDPMLALEQTLNEGATYGAAGSVYLRGLKKTFRSPPASTITSFSQLQDIFLRQLSWLVNQCYHTILSNYCNLADVCPSPLLSALLDGCIENGQDLTSGGAKFHMISTMCVGVASTIDSLYAIKKLCFDPATARATLPEMITCLICDWGFNMIEPYQDSSLGKANAAAKAVRYKELRQEALKLPKWATGDGDDELTQLGVWLIDNVVQLSVDAIRKPPPSLRVVLDRIYEKHGPEFEFVVTPGIGTFEGYVGVGLAYGASADGRRNGMPVASDMSPSPSPQDLPADPKHRNIYKAMKSYANSATEIGISNAAPVDMNIPENFPVTELQQFLVDFAQGRVGGNLFTMTCADLKTYQGASKDAEKYDLLRVRMGGWTEFYATMFPEYQKHQQRRQVFEP